MQGDEVNTAQPRVSSAVTSHVYQRDGGLAGRDHSVLQSVEAPANGDHGPVVLRVNKGVKDGSPDGCGPGDGVHGGLDDGLDHLPIPGLGDVEQTSGELHDDLVPEPLGVTQCGHDTLQCTQMSGGGQHWTDAENLILVCPGAAHRMRAM